MHYKKLGYRVIVNVKWTDAYSYNYCFSGIRYGSVVAVSTLGCLRANADKELFLPGLEELIKRKHPRCIILYGSLTKEILEILNMYNQKFVFFPSQISEAMEAKYGNEGK